MKFKYEDIFPQDVGIDGKLVHLVPGMIFEAPCVPAGLAGVCTPVVEEVAKVEPKKVETKAKPKKKMFGKTKEGF